MPGWTGLKRLLIATALLAIIAPSFGCAQLFGPHSALPRPKALDQEPYRRVKRHFPDVGHQGPGRRRTVDRGVQRNRGLHYRASLPALADPRTFGVADRTRRRSTAAPTSTHRHEAYNFIWTPCRIWITALGENRLAFWPRRSSSEILAPTTPTVSSSSVCPQGGGFSFAISAAFRNRPRHPINACRMAGRPLRCCRPARRHFAEAIVDTRPEAAPAPCHPVRLVADIHGCSSKASRRSHRRRATYSLEHPGRAEDPHAIHRGKGYGDRPRQLPSSRPMKLGTGL